MWEHEYESESDITLHPKRTMSITKGTYIVMPFFLHFIIGSVCVEVYMASPNNLNSFIYTKMQTSLIHFCAFSLAHARTHTQKFVEFLMDKSGVYDTM